MGCASGLRVTADAVVRTTALLAGLLAAGGAMAQTVLLAGSMGKKALLVIDGQPQTLAVGDSASGVTLRQLGDGQAVVERGGVTMTLTLGGAPARLAGTAPGSPTGREIVLPVGLGGHYTGAGAINGRPVQFMVDTGATLVAISQSEAERIGLDWRQGELGQSQTANGTVPVRLLSLDAVRVGDVEVNNVAAVVVPAKMPFVLLGNSFLGRFQMRRDNDVLRLERRP